MVSKINKTLLYLYAEDCRTSQPLIAKKLRKSPQIINYTIKRFGEEGIISFSYSIVDYSYFGMLLFKVYFRGGYSKISGLNQLVEKLRKNRLVTSIYEIGTEYDLLVEFIAKNPSEFNKELKSLISDYPELNNYDIVFNIVSHLYPRNYLLPKNRRIPKYLAKEEIIVGGDREQGILNDTEKKVINKIIRHPKINLSTLSSQLGINIKTAMNAFNSLKKRKILRNCKCSLDIQKLDFLRKRIVLKLHNVDIEKEKRLANFCKATPEIIQFNKTLGKWDIEIDLETDSAIAFRNIYLMIREEFKDIIQSFNSYDIYRLFTLSYLKDVE